MYNSHREGKLYQFKTIKKAVFEGHIQSVVDKALASYDRDSQFGTPQIGFDFSKKLETCISLNI